MKPQRAGFSLVETLLACALLGIVLVPVLSAFRIQLTAASRMRARLKVERTLHERLALSELRLRSGVTEVAPSGFQPDGLLIREPPPSVEPCGATQLWHLDIEVQDFAAEIKTRRQRTLIQALPPQQKQKAQP